VEKNELMGFFGDWSRLQRERRMGIFMMECTNQSKAKKWVIDIDGSVSALHAIGLCESLQYITDTETQNIESLASDYACLVLRCLRDIGFITEDQNVCFSITRRHRRSEEGVVKISLHVTLDIFACHHEWSRAMARVYHAFAKRKHEWLQDYEKALKLHHVDDKHVVGNSAGQNISIVFSSKPVNMGEPRQPIFEFVGLFILEAAKTTSEIMSLSEQGLDYSDGATVFRLTSMLLRDEFSIDARWQPEESTSVSQSKQRGHKRLFQIEGQCANQDETNEFPKHAKRTPLQENIPAFVMQLLFDESASALNFTMPSLWSGLPRCVPEEHRGQPGVVECFKIERPRRCVRYLLSLKPSNYRHASNGCKVCVYRAPCGNGTETPDARVFVMCFACQADGVCRAPIVNRRRSQASLRYGGGGDIFPWCEIFGEDMEILKRIK
jgi:hypothetical protein